MANSTSIIGLLLSYTNILMHAQKHPEKHTDECMRKQYKHAVEPSKICFRVSHLIKKIGTAKQNALGEVIRKFKPNTDLRLVTKETE